MESLAWVVSMAGESCSRMCQVNAEMLRRRDYAYSSKEDVVDNCALCSVPRCGTDHSVTGSASHWLARPHNLYGFRDKQPLDVTDRHQWTAS